MADEEVKAPKDSKEVVPEQEDSEAGSIKDIFDETRPRGGGGGSGGGGSKKDPRRPVS